MTSRARVLLLIPHLGGGGAEHVMALLARGLLPEKYDVHLAIITQSKFPAGVVLPNATLHALGARRVRSGCLALLRLIWRLRPDAILSAMAHLNFLVLLLTPFLPRNTRVLIRQNSTASSSLADGRLPGYTRFLYKLLLVICQSQAMAADLHGTVKLAPERVAVLPNPIDFDAIRSARYETTWSGPGPHLISIGRFSPEKGFDLLLDALARIRSVYPAADLVIAGDGPRRACLEMQSMCLGLRHAVHFAGYLENPFEYFHGADVFVLSSRHEGMPNALLEAAAFGLPIVATPASGGVVDLLLDRPGAWLTPEITADSLAQTLATALSAIQPGQRFDHEFISPFAGAIGAYQDAIDAVIAAGSISASEFTHA